MNRIIKVIFILSLATLSACSDSGMREDLYPWQVKAVGNGHSQVFGLELGKAIFSEAQDIMGRRYDAAIFENRDGSLSLELFYKEITLGGLTAKFVLTLDAGEEALKRLKGRPLKKEIMESGVIKYSTAKNDSDVFKTMKISAITYMPITNLDEEIIAKRFGEPTEKIQTHKSAHHWLYPEKGLDIIINTEGKEILQFVPPREFNKVVRPLKVKK